MCLSSRQPDHEAGLDPGPALVAVERRDLAVDPLPVDLAGELHQLVLHVDDLVEPRPEQIVFTRRLVLLRPHRPLRCADRITASQAKGIRKRNCKVPSPQAAKPCNLKSTHKRKIDSRSGTYGLFTDDFICVSRAYYAPLPSPAFIAGKAHVGTSGDGRLFSRSAVHCQAAVFSSQACSVVTLLPSSRPLAITSELIPAPRR